MLYPIENVSPRLCRREKLFALIVITPLYLHIFIDYRLPVTLQHFIIGFLDVSFWWSVWGTADHYYPTDIRTDGSLIFAKGYGCIITASIGYLLFRVVFYDTFKANYSSSTQEVLKTVIITKPNNLNFLKRCTISKVCSFRYFIIY